MHVREGYQECDCMIRMTILTLWDIDGNLVDVFDCHTAAYQKAIKAIFGISISPEEIIKNYGKPAKENIAAPLRDKGILEEELNEKMQEIFSIYYSELERNISGQMQENSIFLPGTKHLLEAVKSKKLPMGIVTGNNRIAAEIILRKTGLIKYFDLEISGFGDSKDSRSEIVRHAILAAKEKGIIDNNPRIFVFGDTPNDIIAAKHNGCISIAVIKDKLSKDMIIGSKRFENRRNILTEMNPDFLVDDYSDTQRIMDLIKS